MSSPDDAKPKFTKNAQNAAREARLAAALRENLKRRKAQLRDKARAGEPDDPSAAGDAGESEGEA